MTEENIVYIGNKPLMNYVLAVVTQMNNGTNEVILKARGRSISKAVDVAEVVKNKFILDAEVENIHISTEELPNREGSNTNVSAIEVQMINK
jgi:DNA-binding protein